MEKILARGSSPYALLRETSAVRDEPIESAGSERDVAEVDSEPWDVCEERPDTALTVSSVWLPLLMRRKHRTYTIPSSRIFHTLSPSLPSDSNNSDPPPNLKCQVSTIHTVKMPSQLSSTYAISHIKS